MFAGISRCKFAWCSQRHVKGLLSCSHSCSMPSSRTADVMPNLSEARRLITAQHYGRAVMSRRDMVHRDVSISISFFFQNLP
jgi:hypothetical protein